MRLATTSAIVGALITASVAVGALAAPSGIAAKIPFTAKYSGKAVTVVNDDVVDISATGAGTATLIGAGKITGKGTGSAAERPCIPFSGTGVMTGARGTVAFRVQPLSKGCGDEAGEQFSIVGRATVTKATGKLAKARGSLKLTGFYDRASGAYSIKFTGTLTR